MSKVLRGGKWMRPHFSWGHHELGTDMAAATGQLIESLRNLSEDSYARLIHLNEEMLRTLRRMDRRLRTKRGDA